MSYLQSNLDEKGCTAFSELREALETEAELVPLACFSKLVGGKSEQQEKCVEIGSGKERHCLMPYHTLISQQCPDVRYYVICNLN